MRQPTLLSEIAPEWQREIRRLRAENKKIADHWDDVSYERNHLRAINDELVAMLKAVKPYTPPSWQVEIAAALAKAMGEK